MLEGMEAWITSALEESHVRKAIILAGSLRRVYTAKKVVVLSSGNLSNDSREQLEATFDLVIPVTADVGGKVCCPEDLAKCKALSLHFFSKCAYLSPKTLVLRNCDDIFHRYGKCFAARSGQVAEEKYVVDSDVMLFVPSSTAPRVNGATTLAKAIDNILNRDGQVCGKFVELPVQYNWELDGDRERGTEKHAEKSNKIGRIPSIVNFGSCHPLDSSDDLANCDLNLNDCISEMHKVSKTSFHASNYLTRVALYKVMLSRTAYFSVPLTTFGSCLGRLNLSRGYHQPTLNSVITRFTSRSL